MSDQKRLAWGLIGASDIANTRMIPAINTQPDSHVVAVLSSSTKRAQQYGVDNNIPRTYGSLDAFLNDPEIDFVYISTINDLHYSQTLAAAKAGKHVLIEKPLAMTYEDAENMMDERLFAPDDMGLKLGKRPQRNSKGV